MSAKPNAPHFVLAAVQRIYSELPKLVGLAAWAEIQPQVENYIRQLESTPNKYLVSTQLYGLLSNYESARIRMSDELNTQADLSQGLEDQIRQLATSLGFDAETADGLSAAAFSKLVWEPKPETVPTAQELERKRMELKKGGVDGAISVKFRNMRLDKWDFATIVAGFVTTGFDMTNTPHPVFIAGCIILIASTLRNAMKVELDEQDASVFWGMIKATGDMRGAGLSESTVLAETNAERKKYRLDPPLAENQVYHALRRLVEIETVEKSGDNYRIIENYKIKD
ncbi:MAG: hypothetical protein K8J31_04840 [Anaerolineae bacterium]|nr:hypothetical protein [Anaerolineae bacterium]